MNTIRAAIFMMAAAGAGFGISLTIIITTLDGTCRLINEPVWPWHMPIVIICAATVLIAIIALCAIIPRTIPTTEKGE